MPDFQNTNYTQIYFKKKANRDTTISEQLVTSGQLPK